MAVKIGSARSSYGNTKAGDQNGGKEASRQDWYLHSKGWYVLRAIDEKLREKIALAMERACDNNSIGYDQATRNMLWENVKDKGFDPSKTTKAVNCDCSSLVRVCCAYAGIELQNFNTGSQKSVMTASGAFLLFTDDAHCKRSNDLLRGDILVTRSKGHTVVVLSDGSDAFSERAGLVPDTQLRANSYRSLGSRLLRNGSTGADVRELQDALGKLHYDLGRWGTDGEFGDCTEIALRAFQKKAGIEVDGVFGQETLKALLAALEDGGEEDPRMAKNVRIEGGKCYVREGAGKSYASFGVAECGSAHPFEGEMSVDGWYKIYFSPAKRDGWVSGKYGKLV